MKKQYVVRLSEPERQSLVAIVKKLAGSSQKVRRAQILLKADADGPNWSDQAITETFDCRRQTVENLRRRFVTEGFEIAVHGKTRAAPPRSKALDGEQEARILALRLGSPPDGFAQWSLRLLADKVVELEIAESISHETLRQMLKKTGMTKRKIQYWVIPPKADGEFVAAMEDVLDIYSRLYDPCYPVVCMDEQPIQLLKETRIPIPATLNHPQRIDYQYEWAGTASIFMFCEPLSGWRQVRVREQRTKIDWAIEMEALLTNRYARADKVILVCDTLNTHTKGAFYEAFPPKKTRELICRLEFHHTPKHGSWLNIAENELSSLTRQCLKGHRMADITTLRREVSAWAKARNDKQRGIDDARAKLKSLYPNF